jgi:hypothetical protein
MSSDKFLLTGGNALNLNNGTVNILGSSIGAKNLAISMPVRTNASRQLVSSLLTINDISGLQAEIDSVITSPHVGVLEATDFKTSAFNSYDAEVTSLKSDTLHHTTTASSTLFSQKVVLPVYDALNFNQHQASTKDYVDNEITSAAVPIINLGSGADVFSSLNAGNNELRSLTSDAKLTVTQNVNDISLTVNEAALIHDSLSGAGSNTHLQIDNAITASTSHIGTANLHYLQTAIDHTVIQNKGSNTHGQIDAFIASKAANSGLASLGSNGKVPLTQISLSNLQYCGTWDVTTNPTQPTGTITSGCYWIVNVTGSSTLTETPAITWDIGNWAIWNGDHWDRVQNADSVSTVAGYTGVVNLTTSDLTDVTITGLATNDVLQYNGSDWVNKTFTSADIASRSLVSTNVTDINNLKAKTNHQSESAGVSTTFAQKLLPNVDNTIDLGSSTLKFKDLHIGKATGLTTPTADTDATNKAYVDEKLSDVLDKWYSPAMTGFTLNGYTVTTNSGNNSWRGFSGSLVSGQWWGTAAVFTLAGNAYDGSAGSHKTGVAPGTWLVMEIPSEKLVYEYTLRMRNDASAPSPVDWTIIYSTDGTNYKVADTVAGVTPVADAVYNIKFTPVNAKFIGVNVTKSNSTSIIIQNLSFEGLEKQVVVNYIDDKFTTLPNPVNPRDAVNQQSITGLVTPTMTSASQDGYTVTASSVWGNSAIFQPWRVFNNLPNEGLQTLQADGNLVGFDYGWSWGSFGGTFDVTTFNATVLNNKFGLNINQEWIQMELPQSVSMKSFKHKARGDNAYNGAIRDFQVLTSTDGITWVVLLTVTGHVQTSRGQEDEWAIDGFGKYIGISITKNNGASALNMGEVFVRGDSFVREYVDEKRLNRWVSPFMTNFRTDSYHITSNATQADFWKLYDGDISTRMGSNGFDASTGNLTTGSNYKSGVSNGIWVVMELPQITEISQYTITPRTNFANHATEWEIIYSLDNSTYSVADTKINQSFADSEIATFNISKIEARYIGINIIKSTLSISVILHELSFSGRSAIATEAFARGLIGKLKSYSRAAMPSNPELGDCVYVHDATGTAVPAFFNGSVWARFDQLGLP